MLLPSLQGTEKIVFCILLPGKRQWFMFFWLPHSVNQSHCEPTSTNISLISLSVTLKPGLHLLVIIATIAEKSVSDHSDQMDTLLTIPAIVTIAITRIGLGSIPAITSMIITIAAIRTIVIFPRMHCSTGSFYVDFDFAPKNMILEAF